MRLLLRLLLFAVASISTLASAAAQQQVRVKVDGGSPDLRIDIPAQLYLPAVTPAPAVAIFHGCGGVGANNARMAELLRSWGYVALVVDSFTSRGLKDVCGRNWPSQADAEKRAIDIDAAALWLNAQDYVKGSQLAFMGYSYGGGVGLLRALSARTDIRVPSGWRAAILVYPDCGLGEAMGPALRPRLPTMLAMGELDDWTPVKQCLALLERVTADRGLIETHVYPGAHHSFDALGLPVRYLEGVGNRSKPGGCCGAHYGANEAAWKQFVTDVRTFLGRYLELVRR
jgi:dienelactone hydrolase